MKNSSIIILFTCLITCFTACNNAPECKYHSITLDLSTKDNARGWEFDSTAGQFFCQFSVAELTPYVYNYGNWTINREYNYNTANAYQVALPQSIFLADTLEETSVVHYTQYVDFRMGIGYVEIQITNSDHLYGEENPQTMYFRLQAADSVVLNLTVVQEDWQFDTETRQYYCHFDLPEITAEIYDLGQWTISREYNVGTANAYQVDLPQSCFMADTLAESSVVNYSQHIDYRVGIEYVAIQLTNSDYIYSVKDGKPIPPEDMHFRLQLIY
ncbi:MAG: hypothetical protein J5902_06940 [Paludibacteraceae bacterium]|nr:hypothetical protein [Paludibacteraceae bacterium]